MLCPAFPIMTKEVMPEVIPIASDHPAFELKEELKQYLTQLGFQPLDLGTYSQESVDFPIYALSVADKVSKGQYRRGIVVCKTGVGVSIVDNKFPRIRAALAYNHEVAELSRRHTDSNILALGAGHLSSQQAKEIVRTWLFTEAEGERHQRRRNQISIIEKHIIEGRDQSSGEILSSAMLNDTRGREVKISASLMCANQLHLLDDIRKLAEADVDMFHIDIIDGDFSRNISLNIDHIAALRSHTYLPIDVHLMVKYPASYISRLAEAGADIVIVHLESEAGIDGVLDDIKARGMKAGLAINPGTPVEKLYPFLGKISLVLFMGVEPGFKGNEFVPSVIERIRAFSEYAREHAQPVSIMVDGSVGPRTLPHLYQAGARIFVGGTSGLFKAGTFKDNLEQMRSFCC